MVKESKELRLGETLIVFIARIAHTKERDAPTVNDTHSARPLCKYNPGAAHTQRAAHWVERAAHRNIRPRNYPICLKKFGCSSNLKGRPSTSVFASKFERDSMVVGV